MPCLILHDPNGNAMQGHILNAPGNPVITSLRLPGRRGPGRWVWLNQQPLVISPLQSETRWPGFVRLACDEFGLSTLVLVPLTAGHNRLGALGLSSVAPLDPGPAEIAYLERVASEFAVAVESFLARQEAVRERDRLRTLFDITNALVSNLERGELFCGDFRSTLVAHPARLRAADAYFVQKHGQRMGRKIESIPTQALKASRITIRLAGQHPRVAERRRAVSDCEPRA
jgi:GAF domain-containing protein